MAFPGAPVGRSRDDSLVGNVRIGSLVPEIRIGFMVASASEDVSMMGRWGWLTCAVCLCVTSGCAQWNEASEAKLVLPPAVAAPDAVTLEIAFVPIPAKDMAARRAFWNAVDETGASVESRRLWLRNGLRYGIFGPDIPAVLQPYVTRSSAEPTDTGELDDGLPLRGPWSGPTVQQLQVRRDRPVMVMTRQASSEPVVLLHCDADGPRGATLEGAECQFQLRVDPQEDGSVVVRLVPRVEYGQARPRIVAQQGMWVYRPQRESMVLEELQFEARLRPGQIIAVGCADPARSVGETFLAEGSASTGRQRILLIRLQQAPSDHLFEIE